MIYFSDQIDDARLADLLDDRIQKLRETVEHIASTSSQENSTHSAGASFVAGFGAVIAEAAAKYIESNRHLLTDQQEPEQGIAPKIAHG